MAGGRFQFNRHQRMQLKRFICVLGLLLLLFLFLGRLFTAFLKREWGPQKKPEPVIQTFSNVWMMEVGEEALTIFRDGQQETYALDETLLPDGAWREQIGDVEVTDGLVTNVVAKTRKIGGKLLRIDAESVELAGYGRIPLAPDYKGYRVYKTLEMCTYADLAIGYNFTDFVVENGAVCGILQAREEVMDNIRVLIKSTEYESLFHERLTLTADTSFCVSYGAYNNRKLLRYAPGEDVTIEADSAYLAEGRLVITPDALTGRVRLKDVKRNQGVPSYRGHLELERTDGGILVINELSLEEYLYSVVPSEMPSSYPAQALRAQAICARTYAYGHMRRAGYPQYGAHVDDSTSYQVYNNILEQASTTAAVKDSYGQMLRREDGELAETYFYSTSCGMSTDATIWKTQAAAELTYLRAKAISVKALQGEDVQENPDGAAAQALGEALRDEETFAAFIRGKDTDDFEVSDGWYRWSYQVKKLKPEYMAKVLAERYAANAGKVLTLDEGEYVKKPIENFAEVRDIYVAKRGAGGVCDELIIETDRGTYKVISEHFIRYALNNGESKIMRQDGGTAASPSILPSGFFLVEPVREKKKVTGYTLIGGGFGHGVGMSQNGAKYMAEYGMSAEEILAFFFENCNVM